MKKIKNLLLFILFYIAIFSVILIKPLENLDEIWNYNFARNIANGLIAYKDFNIVVTPLTCMICSIFLKLVIDKLIVMRILAAFLCTSIMYILYKLLKELNIKKEMAIIFTFFIGVLLKEYYCIDYNFATLLIDLLLIYYEIKFYNKDKKLFKNNVKSDIFLGILAGLSVTIKQTTGLLICVALLGNKLIFLKNKDEFKLYFKSFIYRLLGIVFPILVLIIYLVHNNAVYNFINYTIKGIREFNNYISYINLINFNVIGFLAIIVPLTFIYAWINSVINEKDKKVYFLLVYGLAIFALIYPISDDIHFLIGAIPSIIILLYQIYNLINLLYIKFIKNTKYKYYVLFFMYFIDFYIIVITIICSILHFAIYINSKERYSKLNHYSNIIIDEKLEYNIKKIDEYILQSSKNTIILDSTAAIYMIPINKYNKNYDMFNKGNLGEKR